MRISALRTVFLATAAIAATAGHPAFANEAIQTQIAAADGATQAAADSSNSIVLAQASGTQIAATTPRPESRAAETVTVTARHISEDVQSVPMAVSVTGSEQLFNTGSFNVDRLAQLQPSLQFYSQNPRNTSVNIRGLGAPLGLTNDGLDQGVGLYVDQVYYNRVAVATLDFVDIDQIEILRGPQGTLYGKNTTAGAINITTRDVADTFQATGEISAGNYDFKQAKISVSGPLADNIGFRFSLSNTTRRGTVWDTSSNSWINGQDNLGLRGKVKWTVNDDLTVTLAANYNVQDPICCGLYYARVGTTQKAANRQYAALAAAFNYTVPSTNPFDRVTDLDAPLRARNEVGGTSVLAEWKVGPGTLTSISAWQYWDWLPRNDRDYTGLPITPQSQNPSKQHQYTQELRYAYAGNGYDFVAGVFAFHQNIHTAGVESNGSAASRWSLNPGAVAVGATGCATPTTRACNPAVLNGLSAANDILLNNNSAALYGKVNWHVTDALTVSPGIRFNYDDKSGHYSSIITGTASDGTKQLVLFTGPYANDAWIVDERGVRAPQYYAPVVAKENVSYDLNVSYQLDSDLMVYGTYAKSFKNAGLNLNGLPADNNGVPIMSAATIKPENVNDYEGGVKSRFWDNRATLNVNGFWTDIKNFQANVNNGALGLVRGYLANAGKVEVRGVETEFSVYPVEGLRAYVNGTYTDHKYVAFVDAPCPPELSGGNTATPISAPGVAGGNSPVNCDISGQWLPGISKWAFSWGGEFSQPANLVGKVGEIYFGYDASFRSTWSSNASRSLYTDVEGYALHNFRVGFRVPNGINLSAWVHNAFDQNYFDQLLVTPSNTGLIAGQPGDPRTYGVTLKYDFN